MKVRIGSSSSVEMTSAEVAEAMQKHFAAHNIDFESVGVDEDGQIELKMRTGSKVVIRPVLRGIPREGMGGLRYESENEISLC